jgi:uracil phosphoribosyltransferase
VATPEEIREESRKVRRLQIVVDLVASVLRQSEIPVEEAAELVAQTRAYALSLFPDKETTYDLLYKSKFQRLMVEKYRMI